MTVSETSAGRSLVSAMERTLGRPLLTSVREAFVQVPRTPFVPAYYKEGHRFTAPSPSDPVAWDAWCRVISQDEAFTTQVDARGLPTSSSSQPSLMAVMLEALALAPGQRVLEIGSGTGYNAALLATLVGDPHLVTTIELDPVLAARAAQMIEQVVGPGMAVVVGNGLDGVAQYAPYDRIISTGSAFPVPSAWIAQLRPHGRLVMDLRGQLSGGILLAQKHDKGHLTGRFLPETEGMSFMRLRATVDEQAKPTLPQEAYRHPIRQQMQLTPKDLDYVYADHLASYEHFHDDLTNWNDWLQWTFPELSIRWRRQEATMQAAVFDASTQTLLTLEPQDEGIAIVVHGERALWSEIIQSAHTWEQMGKPGKAAAKWRCDAQGQQSIRVGQQGEDVIPLPRS